MTLLLLLSPAAHASGGLSLTPDPVLTLIQVVPFLATIFVVNSLVLQPMLAYLEERRTATVGARDEALKLTQQADERAIAYEKKMAAAIGEIAALRAARRADANAARDVRLAEAKKQAEARVASAVETIAGERALAGREMDRLARALGDDIAGKVLGRS